MKQVHFHSVEHHPLEFDQRNRLTKQTELQLVVQQVVVGAILASEVP